MVLGLVNKDGGQTEPKPRERDTEEEGFGS